MSRVSLICLSLYALLTTTAAFLGMPQVALATLAVGLIHGGAILYQKFRLGHVLYHVMESLAHKLEFVPVAKSSAEVL
jgi:uncharacterized protein YhdP